MRVCVNKILYEKDDAVLSPGVSFVNCVDDAIGCDYYFGSINDCRRLILLSKLGERVPRFDYGDMSVSSYLNYVGDCALNNRESYWKLACQLNLLDVGAFCRSDSGDKIWSGQILTEPLIGIIKDIVSGDTQMFLSKARDFEPIEYRCWVECGNLIACGAYVVDITGETDVSRMKISDERIEEIEKFIRRCYRCYSAHERYVLDLCIFHGELKMVEMNCFSTSGFANADCLKRVTDFVIGKFGF